MNAIDSALYSTLSGGTALTALLATTSSIYHIRAPNVSTLPYVVYSLQGGGKENLTPSDMGNYVYFIRAYSATSAKAAGTIHDEIVKLLHGKTLTVTGYTNYWTVLEGEQETAEEEPNAAPIFMSGGLYRIKIDS